jgi:branched-chain amino acid transport system substrate-binding protein
LRSKSRLWRLIAILGVFTLLAAACGDDGDGDDVGDATPTGDGEVERVDVTVYFQGALSGDAAYLVQSAFQAGQLRFDELNAEEGYPANITLEQADTQGNPDNVPPVVEDVVGDENTVAVLGPAFSGESEAAGDSYNDAGIPFVTPSATNPGLADQGWDYWYRGCANDTAQGAIVAEYIQTQDVSNVFVSHDASTYGQGLAEIVQGDLEEAGVTVAGFEGITTGADDFSAFISSVQDSNADFLFFGGYDFDFGKIVAQARDAGLDIPMMSGDGSVSSTFLDLAGSNVTDVVLTAPSNISGEFISKFNQELGGQASSVPVYAAEGYDVASLVGEGIRQAIEGGATDPEGIREGIKTYLDSLTSDNPFQGEAKPYAFDPETHELAALEEDPRSLFFLYEVGGGELTSLGSATEVLGG